VKNLTFGVKKAEVFGFLGTNGAGKTTTMSVLTGEFLPTMGHCTVGGFDVVSESEAAKQVIGYCPQFDALLDLLTPEEHLNLYASLRDIPLPDTPAVVNGLLAACALESYRNVPSKSLSGGNKRKLSVAVALIGGPKIVFLDEPSAGMDPHARRQLWDVIIYVAQHSSVVLTTHHLEEVDVLAHRVGIMVDGELRCLGNLDHLKRKFGGGFEIQIKAASESSQRLVEGLMAEQFKTATVVEQRQQRITYSMPFESTKMSHVFDVLQKAKQSGRFGIADYTVQQTSLEQVFLRISDNEIMSRDPQRPVVNGNDDEGNDDGGDLESLGRAGRGHSSFFLYEEGGGNQNNAAAPTVMQQQAEDREMTTTPNLHSSVSQ
jgi:ABC-type multidrug transport system ATPase subunit